MCTHEFLIKVNEYLYLSRENILKWIISVNEFKNVIIYLKKKYMKIEIIHPSISYSSVSSIEKLSEVSILEENTCLFAEIVDVSCCITLFEDSVS